MSFLLHSLRSDDLFIDIGANIGAFTVLASAVCGARSISFEPVPITYERLRDNIALNRVEDRVTTHNIGVGSTTSTLRVSVDAGQENRVLSSDESFGSAQEVAVRPLDDVLSGEQNPRLVKVDVEGWETEVIAGSLDTLRDPSPRALLVEMNGSGERYGFDEAHLHRTIIDLGYEEVAYHPMERRLTATSELLGLNRLYVNAPTYFEERVRSAPPFRVLGRLI
ncbi:MAG: FkbM family methyltransferase [Bacteroidota bacterium]